MKFNHVRMYYIGCLVGLWLATLTSFFFNDANLLLCIAIASIGVIVFYMVSTDD